MVDRPSAVPTPKELLEDPSWNEKMLILAGLREGPKPDEGALQLQPGKTVSLDADKLEWLNREFKRLSELTSLFKAPWESVFVSCMKSTEDIESIVFWGEPEQTGFGRKPYGFCIIDYSRLAQEVMVFSMGLMAEPDKPFLPVPGYDRWRKVELTGLSPAKGAPYHFLIEMVNEMASEAGCGECKPSVPSALIPEEMLSYAGIEILKDPSWVAGMLRHAGLRKSGPTDVDLQLESEEGVQLDPAKLTKDLRQIEKLVKENIRETGGVPKKDYTAISDISEWQEAFAFKMKSHDGVVRYVIVGKKKGGKYDVLMITLRETNGIMTISSSSGTLTKDTIDQKPGKGSTIVVKPGAKCGAGKELEDSLRKMIEEISSQLN